MEGTDADAKRSKKPSVWRTSVLLSAAERVGRKKTLLNRFMSLLQLGWSLLRVLACSRLFRCVCFWILSLVEASVLSPHQFEAAFPLPASEEKTIKEKNQCILKHIKKTQLNSYQELYLVQGDVDIHRLFQVSFQWVTLFFHITKSIIQYFRWAWFLNINTVMHRPAPIWLRHVYMHGHGCVHEWQMALPPY